MRGHEADFFRGSRQPRSGRRQASQGGLRACASARSPNGRLLVLRGNVGIRASFAGHARDALMAQLGEEAAGTLVVVQNLRPDPFFTAVQRQRLDELMGRWRAARDAGSSLPIPEQAELDGLIQVEVEAMARRALRSLWESAP